MPLVRSDLACQECKVQHIIQLPEHINESRFLNDLKMVREKGRHIQDELHYLTPSQREVLITGYCDEAWYKIFGDGD
jgi:FixJ family two-component response regulator